MSAPGSTIAMQSASDTKRSKGGLQNMSNLTNPSAEDRADSHSIWARHSSTDSYPPSQKTKEDSKENYTAHRNGGTN
jgi:hypothetical protein